MTPQAVFARTFLKASAVLLGITAATFFASATWTAPREVSVPVTAQKLTFEALIANLGAADPAARAKAACDLRKHGEDAAAALGPLVALLEDASPVDGTVCRRLWGYSNHSERYMTTPGQEAAAALVAIGQRAVQPLLAATEGPSWVARRHAAWALGALDEGRAVPVLLRLIRDPQPGVREQAAWALGVLDDRSAVDAVIRAIGDDDARVRRQAAWAAGVLDDQSAIVPLMRALKDPDAGVRKQAAWAIGILGK